MRTVLRVFSVVIALVAVPASVWAQGAITGVVKDFQWRNPHTWVLLAVDDGKGGKVDWAVEGRAPGILLRAGWSKNSLKPGEMITVDMSPARDGSKTGLVARVTKADGTILANAPPPTQ